MRAPLARIALFAGLVGGGLIVAWWAGAFDWLRDRPLGELVAALRGRWWTPLAIAGLATVCGCLPLPLTPIVLAGGAIFGPLLGWCLNMAGAMVGCAAGYQLARALGRDAVERLLGAERWRRLDRLVADHGMFAMIRSRFFLPLTAPNFVAAVTGMEFAPFLLSSFLGMALPIAVYTYVGHLLIRTAGADPTHTLRNAALVVLAMLAITLLPAAWRRWRR